MGRALGWPQNTSCSSVYFCFTFRFLFVVIVTWLKAENWQMQKQKQSTNQRHAEQDERHLRAVPGTGQGTGWGGRRGRDTGITNWPTAADVAGARLQVLLMQIACLEACNQLSADSGTVRVIWATTCPNSVSVSGSNCSSQNLHLDRKLGHNLMCDSLKFDDLANMLGSLHIGAI